jgi:death-on-curing protein
VTFEFVRADVLRNVHGRLIEKYGGIAGVRDNNALESAMARPQNLQTYGGVDSAAHLGAALAWSLLRNHPFADGNKRSAFAAMDIFFEINGHRLTCSEVEETAMVLRAAASEITEDEWTAWVEQSVNPAEPA